MITADELLDEINSTNAKLIAQHPEEDVLDLMARAALAGMNRGSNMLVAIATSEQVVLNAKGST